MISLTELKIFRVSLFIKLIWKTTDRVVKTIYLTVLKVFLVRFFIYPVREKVFPVRKTASKK
jgi:hypothetical protein